MKVNPARRKRRRDLAMGGIVPLPSDNEDVKRTVSDQFIEEDAPDGMVVESVDEVIDEVVVEQEIQPEETLLSQAVKEAVRLRS
jgi:hypothetical protein